MRDSKKLKLPGDSRWLQIVGSLTRVQLFDIIYLICKREIAVHHLHPWKVLDECTDYFSILKGRKNDKVSYSSINDPKKANNSFWHFCVF